MRGRNCLPGLAATVFLLPIAMAGCSGRNALQQPPPSNVVVTVTPSSANVILGASQQFIASVTGTSNTGVSWAVNGIPGGSAIVGTIDSNGLYTAPGDLPSPTSANVSATSQANAKASAQAVVTVTSDIAVTVATSPTFTLSVPTNSTIALTASITSQGKPDQNVSWAVNGIAGGNATVGTISSTGTGAATYQAPVTVPTPFTVTIAATSVADDTKSTSLPMIVAGTIATVTQTVSAADGGTISLPDGSSATIPAGFLSADQTVMLSEYSAPLHQPQSGFVVGVGPALYLTFSTPVQPQVLVEGGLSTYRAVTRSSSVNSTNQLVGISFNINFGVNLPSLSSATAAVGSFVDQLGTTIDEGAVAAWDSSLRSLQVTVSCDAGKVGVGTVMIGAFAIDLFQPLLDPLNSPKAGLMQWEGDWVAYDPSQKCLDPVPSRTLIVVHGMLSSVEASFSSALSDPTGLLVPDKIKPKYDAVLGFNYDWSGGIAESGQFLANVLDEVAQCAPSTSIDIMAHSEGVPVSLYAVTRTSATTKTLIRHLVGVAGPILGTPIANFSGGIRRGLLTIFSNLPPNPFLTLQMVPPRKAGGGLLAVVNDQFAQDLETDGLGSTVLSDTIRRFDRSDPLFDSGLSNLDLILVAGEKSELIPGMTDFCRACLGIFQGEPFDGIVGLDSSFAEGIDAQIHRIPAFSKWDHIELVPDTTAGGVIDRVAAQLNSSPPSLTISTTSPQTDCADDRKCAGPAGSVFAFAVTGFVPNTPVLVYTQDPTGTQDSPVKTQVDSHGNLNWSDQPFCSKATGTYGVWVYDPNPPNVGSSNAVIEEITGPCVILANPIPTLTTVSPAAVSVGGFSVTVTGTNFVPGAQVMFGGTALPTQFVSATQLTATGTAAISQVGSVPVTVVNPTPGGGTSNSILVTVVNTSTSSSGSTGILTGNVGGQTVDLAYVPQPSFGTVAVINVDATSPTGALVTPILMPSGYTPNATAANPATSQVIVISYSSPVIQLIDATKNTIVNSFTAPVTAFAGYSGGTCQICGAVIDPVSGKAVLDTAQGTILLNLATGAFSPAWPTLAAENFAFNPNTRTALLPTYGQGAFTGLQALNTDTGAVTQLSSTVGSEPDSAAVDISTNIGVIPDEFTGIDYLVNMQQAAGSGVTFTAPSTAFQITAPACQQLWTLASVENVSHLLFAGTEFDSCLGVAPLPTAVVSGAPPTPASFVWGRMPAAPDGSGWDNGGDPHGIAVFTSVVDGKPYGFLVDNNGPWVARIDLKALTSAPPLDAGYPGQIDPAPYVAFLKTQ